MIRQTPPLLRVGLVAFAFLASVASYAQDYPTKPLSIVVTLPAGSTVDALARTFGQQLSLLLKQPVVIDNRAGAGLVLGMQAVAAARADGYTLAFTPATPLTIQPHRIKQMNFDMKTFVPLCQTFENIFFLAVPANSPIKDVKSFLTQAKEQPGRLQYGHSGVGSAPHLMAAEFFKNLDVTVGDVPYRGETAFTSDLVAGMVPSGIVTTALATHQKFRPLVAFASKRSQQFPDVPTAGELGTRVLPSGYGGLFVRAGTPPEVITKLESACQWIVASAPYQTAAAAQTQNATYLNRAAFAKRLNDDTASKGRLLSTLKLAE